MNIIFCHVFDVFNVFLYFNFNFFTSMTPCCSRSLAPYTIHCLPSPERRSRRSKQSSRRVAYVYQVAEAGRQSCSWCWHAILQTSLRGTIVTSSKLPTHSSLSRAGNTSRFVPLYTAIRSAGAAQHLWSDISKIIIRRSKTSFASTGKKSI